MPDSPSMGSSPLPSGKKELIQALDHHVHREVTRMTSRATMWALFYLYLNGVRKFPGLDFERGEVRYNFENNYGRLEYRHQELLAKVDRFVGWLSGMDVSPVVSNTRQGLGAVRERAVAQVISDALITPESLDRAKSQALHNMAVYGGTGLQAHVVQDPQNQFGIDYEIFHPIEAIPFPSVGIDRNKASGIIRRRFVPLSFIEDRFGKDAVSRNIKKMYLWKVRYGQEASDVSPFYGSMNVNAQPDGAFRGAPSDASISSAEQLAEVRKKFDVMCEVREVYLDGPMGYLDRYIVQLGKWIPIDIDYRKQKILAVRTVRYERLIDGGSFHGQGLMDLMMPLNREIETMLARMFENVRSLEKYGLLLLPSGAMDRRVQFKDDGLGLGIGFWEPEAWRSEGSQRPLLIPPANTGEMPGRVAATASAFLEEIFPTPEIMRGEAPGRVDSAAGLQFLGAQANNLSAPMIQAYVRLFSGAHRSAVSLAIRKLAETGSSSDKDGLPVRHVLPVSRLDESLAGAVVSQDDQSGAIELELSANANPLPDQSKLSFSVRDVEPQNKLARRREVLELYTQGVITLEQLMITNLKEGLDLPIYAPHWEGSYRKAVINVLALFNDGQTPGQVVSVADEDVPAVHLMLVNGFMSTPEYSLASAEVRDAFIRYKNDLRGDLGEVLPGNTPPPDDAAILDNAQRTLEQVDALAQQASVSPQG